MHEVRGAFKIQRSTFLLTACLCFQFEVLHFVFQLFGPKTCLISTPSPFELTTSHRDIVYSFAVPLYWSVSQSTHYFVNNFQIVAYLSQQVAFFKDLKRQSQKLQFRHVRGSTPRGDTIFKVFIPPHFSVKSNFSTEGRKYEIMLLKTFAMVGTFGGMASCSASLRIVGSLCAHKCYIQR